MLRSSGVSWTNATQPGCDEISFSEIVGEVPPFTCRCTFQISPSNIHKRKLRMSQTNKRSNSICLLWKFRRPISRRVRHARSALWRSSRSCLTGNASRRLVESSHRYHRTMADRDRTADLSNAVQKRETTQPWDFNTDRVSSLVREWNRKDDSCSIATWTRDLVDRILFQPTVALWCDFAASCNRATTNKTTQKHKQLAATFEQFMGLCLVGLSLLKLIHLFFFY